MNSVPLPMLVEMIGYAGYDFVILDLEHLLRDPVELEHAIRAAECSNLCPFVNITCLIRELSKRKLIDDKQLLFGSFWII